MEFPTRHCVVATYLTFLCIILCSSQQSAKSLWSPSPNYFYHHENHRYDNWDNYYNYYNSFGSRTGVNAKSSSTTTPKSKTVIENKSREHSAQLVLKEKVGTQKSSKSKVRPTPSTNVTVEVISRRTGKSFYKNVRSAGFAKWKHVCCNVLKHFVAAEKFSKVRRLCRRFKCYRDKDQVQEEPKIVISLVSSKPESSSTSGHAANKGKPQHNDAGNAYWTDWHDPNNENGEQDGWKPGTGMELDGWKQEKGKQKDDGWKPGTGMDVDDGWKPGTGMDVDDGWKPGTGMDVDDGWKPGTGMDYEGWKPLEGNEMEMFESKVKIQKEDNMLAVSFTLVLSMIAIVTGIFLVLGVLNAEKVITQSHKKVKGSGEATTHHPPSPTEQALELIQHIHVHLQGKHSDDEKHDKKKESKEHDEKHVSKKESEEHDDKHEESKEHDNKHEESKEHDDKHEESKEHDDKHESQEASIQQESVEKVVNHDFNSNSNSNEDDEFEGIQQHRPPWKNPLPKKPKPWRRPKRPVRKRPRPLKVVTEQKTEASILPVVPKVDKVTAPTSESVLPVAPEVVSAVTDGKQRTDLEKKELAKEVLGLTAESMHTAAYSLLLVNVLGEILEDALHVGGNNEGAGGKTPHQLNETTVVLKNQTIVGIAKNYTLVSGVPENIENRTFVVPVLAEKSENRTVIPFIIPSSKFVQPIPSSTQMPIVLADTTTHDTSTQSENLNNQTTSQTLPENFKAQLDVAVPAPVVQNTRNNFFSRNPGTTTRRPTTTTTTEAPTTRTTTTVMPKDAVAGLFYKKIGSEIWPTRYGSNTESQTWTGYAPRIMKKKEMSKSIEITAFGS